MKFLVIQISNNAQYTSFLLRAVFSSIVHLQAFN